jgi:hypothetical protein
MEGLTGAVPEAVWRRTGSHPQDVTGLGSSRVLRGNGYVVKAGPPDRIAREVYVLGGLADRLPLAVPRLIEWGPGWLVMADARRGDPPAGWSPAPMRDLAAMHEAFAETAAVADPRLADPFGADLSRFLAAGADVELPPPLAELHADPAPLLAALDGLPVTLVHGDAWWGNLVWASGCPVWIDWEECSRAPAVADLATWVYGSAFVPPTRTPERDLVAYGPVDRRAVEAAFLLLFLALDVPVLSEVADALTVVTDRRDRARRWNRGR